jgi:hypothetical protein
MTAAACIGQQLNEHHSKHSRREENRLLLKPVLGDRVLKAQATPTSSDTVSLSVLAADAVPLGVVSTAPFQAG